MKANEFRIGNWVNQPTADNSDSFHQITKGDFASDYNSSIDIECHLPIPLTEDWLLKFGFEKVKNVNENTYPDFRKRSVELLTNVNEFYVLNRNEGFTDIHYVHQLQNLYFALTGEELTA